MQKRTDFSEQSEFSENNIEPKTRMIETFTTDELLPQRPPFVMIDRLRDVTDTTTETELTVREDNIFYQGGVLREAGIIENIAQTCAARLGYVSLVNHRPVA